MRIAVVGLEIAGAALAGLLHDAGHDVVVLDRSEDPGPVEAGILLDDLSLRLLDRLDLLAPVQARSREVVGTRGQTSLGADPDTLFALLLGAVHDRSVPVALGIEVTGIRPAARGMIVETTAGDQGSYDLVVGCDGSRSRVRHSMGVSTRDRPADHGALWSVVDDPEGLAGPALHQHTDGLRGHLAIFPTGLDKASVLWSARSLEIVATASDLTAWQALARPCAAHLVPLIDRVDHLQHATYRDVAVHRPYRVTDGAGLAGRPHPAGAVLVGDAAHSRPSLLGSDTSPALTDVWLLHRALTTHARGPEDLGAALGAYAASRPAHPRRRGRLRPWSRRRLP